MCELVVGDAAYRNLALLVQKLMPKMRSACRCTSCACSARTKRLEVFESLIQNCVMRMEMMMMFKVLS